MINQLNCGYQKTEAASKQTTALLLQVQVWENGCTGYLVAQHCVNLRFLAETQYTNKQH